MVRSTVLVLLIGTLFGTHPPEVVAQDDEQAKLRAVTAVVDEMLAMSEQAVPRRILEEAHAIAVLPGVVKAGFLFAGRRGRGVLMVRRDTTWSAPAFLTITGGSFGLQAGASSTDVVLIFRNRGSVTSLIDGKLTLGGTVSVAAGPVGRSAEAATDARLKAEIYSYSRSRGAFAGLSIEGAQLSFSQKNNRAVYGRDVSVHDILYRSIAFPPAADRLHALLHGIDAF